jgi:hypothetical protein
MDLAAVVAAGARAKGRVATAAVSNLNRRPPAGVMRFFRVTPNHPPDGLALGQPKLIPRRLQHLVGRKADAWHNV